MDDLATLYKQYLVEEGYRPWIDDDGDVLFKAEGRVYFLGIDAEDPTFFKLVLPNFWSLDSDDERVAATMCALATTRDIKVTKVFTVEDSTWATIEMFLSDPTDISSVFPRALRALQAGVLHFAQVMGERN